MAPRVTLFSGEARNTMVAATSLTFGHLSYFASGIEARLAGVSMMEGATALTRMSCLTTSSASATVNAATAALVAVYAPILAPLRHSSAGRAATLTMRPPFPVAAIALTAAAEHRKALTR